MGRFWSNLFFALLAFCISLSATAADVPAYFTYQGRLFNATGTEPLTSVVSLRFQIFDPNGTCLLYEETQTNVDLGPTNGIFATQVGSPVGSTKRSGGDPGLNMSRILANAGSLIRSDDSATTNTCAGGYTPVNGDSRRLRVSIQDDGVTTTLSPDQIIASQPYATIAQTIQGIGPDGFIRANGTVGLTQIAAEQLVSMGDASTLHHHDSLYVKRGDTGNQNLGSGHTYTTGRIGVGTSSPATDIEIERTNPTFRLEATSGMGGTSQIQFYSGTSERARIETPENSNTLKFMTGGLSALTLDTNQNASFASNIHLSGYLDLGDYDDAAEAALLTYFTSCADNCKGATWFNTNSNLIRYWNGSSIATVGESLGNGFVKLDGSSTMAGGLNMGAQTISNTGHLQSVTASIGGITLASGQIKNLVLPTQDTDAASKAYVDSVVGAISIPSSGGSYVNLDGTSTLQGNWNIGGWNLNNIGRIGIGTLTPGVSLAVNGSIQLGDGGEDCTGGSFVGVIRYNNGLQVCDGTTWQGLGSISNGDFTEVTQGVSSLTAGVASLTAGVDGIKSDYLKRDGSQTMTGNWNFGGFLLRNLASPTSNSDAATKSYVDTIAAAVSASAGKGDFLRDGTLSMTGNIRMAGNYISNNGANNGIRLNNNGEVFLGGASQGSFTRNPALTIAKDSAPYIVLEHVGNDTMMIGIDNAKYATFAAESSLSGIKFRVNGDWDSTPYVDDGNVAMTILKNSNVGIGTVSPGAKLHVVGNTILGTVTVTAGRNIQNLAAPVNAADAATKSYVDTALSGVSESKFRLVNGDIAVAANDKLLVDSTSGQLEITLPITAGIGDVIEIIDAAGNFDVNPIVIHGNGNKIMGLDESMTVSTKNISFGLVYAGSTFGWRIK